MVAREWSSMDTALHDLRNDLAVAIASLEAFIDGKLEPSAPNCQRVLDSLYEVSAKVSSLAPGLRAPASAGNEALLGAIVEGSPYAKILVDAQGRIALINAQTEKLFGYSRAELLGQTIDVLVPERFRRGHPALRDSFNESPIARPMGAGRDLYGRRKDGSEVPIEIGLNPIASETGSFTLAAISDITERKRAEELRLIHAGVQQHATALEELNRELASASRFKTQFVATMSHELRTPLTAIIGAAELLSTAKLGERERISVETISEAAEALFALIRSNLDFSKIEAGKVDLEKRIFEVQTVVEGAAEVVAQMAREKGTTLHAFVDPLIPRVEGDADRLKQILLNLLANAVKFTEGGRVVVRASPFRQSGSDIVLRFEVEDTGIGIPAEMLPQLFEPFSQVDRMAARNVGGTGLGLSISKSLAELLGGEIGVTSTPGAGSLFWFTAAFAIAEERARSDSGLEGAGGLIISGDDTFAQIVERYLTSWAMKTRRAVSGSDVADGLQTNDGPAWVAIVDLDDIGISDIGVTVDILRALHPSRVITIGTDGALRKPLRQSNLFDAVSRAISAETAVPARPTAVEPRAGVVGRVLVVEDNERLQQLLRLQFNDVGVPATFVSDGLQAVEAAEDGYDLIFMDCLMPNMDGLAATKAIRERERHTGGHVPIVAMTANAFAEDRDACMAAGMDDYLAKPVRLADIRRMTERWLHAAASQG